ncbi:phenylalanine--tRNA ligase subunit beta [Parafrankia sp. BMG5.11]|uniref:phenylalanine--tRNA ligase subunit beta n=1 Tax=Parafrankia sp. BMG5.11 TaxID=222540 RepID=UPI001038C61E|nr:phenylalanine--tRNA ligase subunit beta [Parafrankia sp. BMG5.11]TCJ41245.1 phenylalanine--tRNA ligase subunit beta [Parafrankia sp. BMG5.11]
MKFSLEWLRHFLNTEASVAEIAATLNRIGHEVEGIEDPADKLAGFRVAEVLTAAPHPQADKLQVLTVSTGDGEPLQVVCGAPNARAGMKGVLGLPGAVVPANGMELRKSAIRGVESNGMMCSVRELELGEEHDGIIELPADAPVGADFARYHGTSPVFDVAITPNRPDCMGVYGIARDLAAAGIGTFAETDLPRLDGPAGGRAEIRIDDAEGCPAFYGCVIEGVTNGESPDWMQRLLKSAGQRPISAIVDITNYVMLTYGRPSHAYDLARLSGPVVARRARAGEQVLALNEKTYTLDETMTVIADDQGVHDIAGIMGGEHSAVTPGTTDVLLEIAYFDPARIGATGRKLGLASDARSRFERGVDPAFLEEALTILAHLIKRHCGGRITQVMRVGAPPSTPKTIAFDAGLTQRLGGIEVAEAEQRRILESLGFAVSDDWHVTVPLRRHDVEGAADLVEEVVRIHGLDNVPSTPLPRPDGVARPTATPEQIRERKVRRAAAAAGLNEAITWSFVSPADAAAVGGGVWTLENPISEELKVMRPSLFPGLLKAVRRNFDRGADSLRLFEIGRRYTSDGELPTLVAVLAGHRTARDWQTGKPQPFDAFDAKALCLDLLAAAGAPVANLQVMGEAGALWHPGRSATLRLGPKTILGRCGMVHPSLLRAFDVSVPVAACSIYFDAIPPKKNAAFVRPAYAPPALQAVTRDFAFLVDQALPAGDLVRTVKGADKVNVVAARVFDDFRGAGIPEGKKSLAVEVVLQPGDKTYTEADLTGIADKIIGAAGKLGAELRA